MSKVVECHQKVQSYLESVFQGESINATSTGWSIFNDPGKPEELGEVSVGATIYLERTGVRVEVRRVLLENDEPDMTAQSIVGELLMKIDKILNPKKSRNEGA